MSTARYATSRTHDPMKVDGKWLCRWCKKPCPGRRRSFCSDECLDELMIRRSGSWMRAKVLKRDKGVCSVCGIDTVAAKSHRDGLRTMRWNYPPPELRVLIEGAIKNFDSTISEMGFPRDRLTWWNADHIKPVVEGGGSCGLDNIRTLCIPCHKRVTAELAARRAEKRKRNRSLPLLENTCQPK